MGVGRAVKAIQRVITTTRTVGMISGTTGMALAINSHEHRVTAITAIAITVTKRITSRHGAAPTSVHIAMIMGTNVITITALVTGMTITMALGPVVVLTISLRSTATW